MQAAGEPLKLKFAKGPYGPYAENLRHVLNAMEGHLVSGYADGGDAPDKQLELMPGALDDARAFLADKTTTQTRFERVSDLVEGFESSFGLELLATVHWIVSEGQVRTFDDLVNSTYAWNARKRQFSRRQLWVAVDVLSRKQWIRKFDLPDRILLTNVGDFLPGDVETVIRQDAPQAIYRNPFLVGAMVELNLIDTQGGGIKRMFHTQRQRFFPLPDYDLTQGKRVAVGIHGRILDEHYTRTLMERTDLFLEQVMLLDQVQKRRRISKEAHRRLKADGLVEGRYPNLLVSGPVARMTGDAGRHIRERGFDKYYYMDMIHALVREHGPVSRKEINQALRPKLPDRLTDEQKRTRIHNILQEMRRSGLISNQGSRAQPIWTLGEVPPERAAFVRRGGDPTQRRGKGFFYKRKL